MITNKTMKVLIEDFKEEILDAIADEELNLWHGSTLDEAGWNKALERVREIIKFELMQEGDSNATIRIHL